MSYNFETLHRSSDNKFLIDEVETDTCVELNEMFPMELWDCEEAFKMAGIRGYEPMTAKELDTEEKQDEVLNSADYFIEEKFDGTRALVYFLKQTDVQGNDLGFCRVFSRRISKKTGFYVENTDSVPQIREIDIPSLGGTILDGEMFINGRPFKDVSSTLNCLWDKAVDRQIDLGYISLHAFDIIFYKGIDLRKMPLERRKDYLHLAVEEANSPYIEEVTYQSCGQKVSVGNYEENHGSLKEVYSQVVSKNQCGAYPHFCDEMKVRSAGDKTLTPRAFYEYIVATGGEGAIIKPKKGLYHHKRGWEYSKIKKFLTREMILIKFDEPTREYSGKAPKDWGYYEGDTPVTKFYYNKQVGNMILGVILTNEELEHIPIKKRGNIYDVCSIVSDLDESQYNSDHVIMEVCECAGFDDEERAYFTRNRLKMQGAVIEVKANEIMRDTGRLRHPRYLRVRNDKEPNRCMWSDHIL